jgi:hypothetical protein
MTEEAKKPKKPRVRRFEGGKVIDITDQKPEKKEPPKKPVGDKKDK